MELSRCEKGYIDIIYRPFFVLPSLFVNENVVSDAFFTFVVLREMNIFR